MPGVQKRDNGQSVPGIAGHIVVQPFGQFRQTADRHLREQVMFAVIEHKVGNARQYAPLATSRQTAVGGALMGDPWVELLPLCSGSTAPFEKSFNRLSNNGEKTSRCS